MYFTITFKHLVQVRFTRAFKGLISPPSEPPGEIMSFGVSPVHNSDSSSLKPPNQSQILYEASIGKGNQCIYK